LKQLIARGAATVGTALALSGGSLLLGTGAFAATQPPGYVPVPSDVHYEITSMSGPSMATAGQFMSVTVSVYEANPDLLSNGHTEVAQTEPAIFPFTFSAKGSQPIYVDGVMPNPNDPQLLDPQVPEPGDFWSYTYSVPVPDVATKTTFTVSGGSGVIPSGLTDAQLSDYPPLMLHYSASTYSSYNLYLKHPSIVITGWIDEELSPDANLYVNQSVDSDDPIYGTRSFTVTILPPPAGETPEVPYAAALPALLAVAGGALWFAKSRKAHS